MVLELRWRRRKLKDHSCLHKEKNFIRDTLKDIISRKDTRKDNRKNKEGYKEEDSKGSSWRKVATPPLNVFYLEEKYWSLSLERLSFLKDLWNHHTNKRKTRKHYLSIKNLWNIIYNIWSNLKILLLEAS